MATTTESKQLTTPNGNKQQGVVKFTPLGETSEITLSLGIVKRFIAARTKSGRLPDDTDIYKFIMLCKARELNPWVGDAYLVGFDSQDGPQFNLITAIQSFYKRAELNPNYDGMESGITILHEDGTLEDRQGDFMLPNEKLVGGWAKCYRKDQRIPTYDRLKLETYSTGRSRWRVDPAGMIAKCAEASVLRKAFPNQTSALYLAEEMQRNMLEGDGGGEPKRIQHNSRTDQLADALDDAPDEPDAYPDHGDAGEESQEADPAFGEKSQEAPEELGGDAMALIAKMGDAGTVKALEAIFGEANQLKLAGRLSDHEFAEIKAEFEAAKQSLKPKK